MCGVILETVLSSSKYHLGSARSFWGQRNCHKIRELFLIRVSQTACRSLPVMLGVSRSASSQEHPLPQSLKTQTHTVGQALLLPSVFSLNKLDGSWRGGVDVRWADLLYPYSWEKIVKTPPAESQLSEWLKRTNEDMFFFFYFLTVLSCARKTPPLTPLEKKGYDQFEP